MPLVIVESRTVLPQYCFIFQSFGPKHLAIHCIHPTDLQTSSIDSPRPCFQCPSRAGLTAAAASPSRVAAWDNVQPP